LGGTGDEPVLEIVRPAADMPALPDAGQQAQTIKSLSDEEIAALRNGEGIGTAVLNGYPGPALVLTLAHQLGLTESQAQQVTALSLRVAKVVLLPLRIGFGSPGGGLIGLPISFLPKNKLHLSFRSCCGCRHG
jgi:hypothetical protein